MSQGQFEFDIHKETDLKDAVSKYEVNPCINNKVIASVKKEENFINLTSTGKVNLRLR
jgi:hypothetical protein